jgi:hypothetical protein
MSQDQILANAAAAAATPATGPTIDAVERERQAITTHKDWYTNGPEKSALLERMRRLTSAPDVVAAEDKAKADVAAKTSPTEKRRQELMQPGSPYWDKNHEKHAEAVAEMRKILATDTEDPASANAAGVEDVVAWAESMRARFGVEQPKLYTVERGEDFTYHEGNALAFLAREGASPEVVRDIYTDFHEAIDNGTGVLDDEAIDRLAKKYESRLGAKAVATLRKWYTDEVRGA